MSPPNTEMAQTLKYFAEKDAFVLAHNITDNNPFY